MESTLRSRHELLAELCADPLTKPELVERVSVSRSTVDRAIRELQLCGFVEATNSQYRVTETGRLALEAYLSYRGTLETIETASPMLEAVPSGTIAYPFLRGATIDLPNPRAPLRVLEESRRLICEAETLHGTGPVAFDQHLVHLVDAVESGGLTCELILDRGVFESFGDDDREQLREVVRTDGGRLLLAPLAEQFSYWFTDDGSTEHAGMTVYDEKGIAGVIRNDDPAAVEWVRERYYEVRSDAEVVWEFE